MSALFVPNEIRAPQSPQAFTLGGNTVSFQLDKSSIIPQLNLVIEGTIATAATTPYVGGLAGLAQNVRVQFTAPGLNHTPVNGLNGDDLTEIYQFKTGQLPRVEGALNATGYFKVYIPIEFKQNFFPNGKITTGATGSQTTVYPKYANSLPANACSDITLSFQSASQAQMDSGNTLVISSCNVFVQQEIPDPTTIPAPFQYVKSAYELTVINAQIVTGTQQQINISAGGRYTLMLMRAFSGVNTKQADGTGVPFTDGPQQQIQLLDLLRRVKYDTSFNWLRNENAEAVTYNANYSSPLVPGNAAFVFNRALNESFNTAGLSNTTNQVPIMCNFTAGGGASIRIVTERYWDDSNYYQLT
jgi:hypothetical protein